MDKLEQYLHQVCRSIGGTRSLREHVRQELREHLLDAVAQHKAAGLPEGEALDRALEEFGKPDDVRSELEATHGHRLMAVVIDKAMQWKERTMRAKWLWTTWAYLALVLVIALEVLCIVFNVVYIIPKLQKLTHDGIIDPAVVQQQGVSWMSRFLTCLQHVGNYTTFILLAAVAAVGLFEWRVKSENKPFMRLSALGTVAAALMVVVVLMAGSLVIPFCVGVPAVGRMARPFAVDQVAHLDTAVGALAQAQEKKDWEAMWEQADRASEALGKLANAPPAVPALVSRPATPSADELRADVSAAEESLREAQQAIREKDAARLDVAMQAFRKSFGPVREAAKRPAR
jgi:hypothetical protein